MILGIRHDTVIYCTIVFRILCEKVTPKTYPQTSSQRTMLGLVEQILVFTSLQMHGKSFNQLPQVLKKWTTMVESIQSSQLRYNGASKEKGTMTSMIRYYENDWSWYCTPWMTLSSPFSKRRSPHHSLARHTWNLHVVRGLKTGCTFQNAWEMIEQLLLFWCRS